MPFAASTFGDNSAGSNRKRVLQRVGWGGAGVPVDRQPAHLRKVVKAECAAAEPLASSLLVPPRFFPRCPQQPAAP